MPCQAVSIYTMLYLRHAAREEVAASACLLNTVRLNTCAMTRAAARLPPSPTVQMNVHVSTTTMCTCPCEIARQVGTACGTQCNPPVYSSGSCFGKVVHTGDQVAYHGLWGLEQKSVLVRSEPGVKIVRHQRSLCLGLECAYLMCAKREREREKI